MLIICALLAEFHIISCCSLLTEKVRLYRADLDCGMPILCSNEGSVSDLA